MSKKIYGIPTATPINPEKFGGNGTESDGGYYTPKVSQIGEDVMRITYFASNDKMPDVSSVDIPLPRGKDGDKGEDYVLTEADKQEIADMVTPDSGEIPTALPNPYALTFTGAVEATYDGSTPVSVNIPQGGGGGGGSAEWNTRTLTTTEETALVSFETPTEYEEIRFFIGIPTSSTSRKVNLNIYVHGNSKYVYFNKKPISSSAQFYYAGYIWHTLPDKTGDSERLDMVVITGGNGSVMPMSTPAWAEDTTPRIEFTPNVSGEAFPANSKFGVMWR